MSGHLCARGPTPSVPSFFGRVRKPKAKDGLVRVTPSSPSGRSKPSRDLLGEPNKVLRVSRGDAEDAQPDAGLHEVASKGLVPPIGTHSAQLHEQSADAQGRSLRGNSGLRVISFGIVFAHWRRLP
jgi:hypothetical protein